MFIWQLLKHLFAIAWPRLAHPTHLFRVPKPTNNPIKTPDTLLKGAKVTYEYEPSWVTNGQVPDYFCSRPAEFWCEVKSLERSKDFAQLSNANTELHKRIAGVSAPGRGFAYVSARLQHRDAKIVIHLLNRALKRLNEADAPDRVIALIPTKPDYNTFVRFSISTKEHTAVEFHCCVSNSGKYGNPADLIPEPYSQMARLYFSSGEVKDIAARAIMTMRDDFRVAIVAQSDDDPFKILMTAPTGPAKRIRNPERIRGALGEANDQFKNALRFKKAPCLLMIFQDGLDVPEAKTILSALYGDLKYTFSSENKKAGKLILEGNGAWTQNKNRSTSAVIYIRNNGEPLIVHNRWAYQTFPSAVFSCKEITLLESGEFKETNYT